MSTHRIPLAGVIGAPISHSRSPRLFAHWLSEMGIEGHYAPLHVEPADFEQVIRTLPRMGFRGANVTLPHKEAALAIADRVSDRARRIGAANTLTFGEDGIHADNTDGHGFVANLRQGAPDWQPGAGPAVVLGAGGAARAVLDSLIEAGVPTIRLANRTRARAETLAATFGPKIEVIDWDRANEAFDGAATVVNTTSLGMKGPIPSISTSPPCPLRRWSPTSSTCRSTRRCSSLRGRAAAARSTGSACCCIRRCRVSSAGSARRPK